MRIIKQTIWCEKASLKYRMWPKIEHYIVSREELSESYNPIQTLLVYEQNTYYIVLYSTHSSPVAVLPLTTCGDWARAENNVYRLAEGLSWTNAVWTESRSDLSFPWDFKQEDWNRLDIFTRHDDKINPAYFDMKIRAA